MQGSPFPGKEYFFLFTQIPSAHLRGSFSTEEVPPACSQKGTEYQASGLTNTKYETQEHNVR